MDGIHTRGGMVVRRRTRWSMATGLAAFGLIVAGCGTQASFTPPTFPPGNEIAGAQLFLKSCATCHGPTAAGTVSLAPRLWKTGGVISPNYSSLATLTAFVYYNMPKDAPGSLTRHQASNVSTFLWGLDGKQGGHRAEQLLAMLMRSRPSRTTPSPTTSSAP